MSQVFKIKKFKDPSIFQKLLRLDPGDNLIISINNLLASNNLMEIDQNEILELQNKYKVDVYLRYKNELIGMYKEYLTFCLADSKISENEILELKKLKSLLFLKDNDITEVHNEIGSQIFREKYSETIQDGRLNSEKEEFLEKLQNELSLPKELADRISGEVRSNYLQSYVKEITADQRLSPDELLELEEIKKSLNINVEMTDKSINALYKMKLFWVIENSDLPEYDCNLALQKGEKCYYKTDANWYENRRLTKSVKYAGPGLNFRIMKGVYYRAGSMKVERVTEINCTLIESGEIILTNKKLIFIGTNKSTNIQLGKILTFIPYENGIEIVKTAGRNPIFIVGDDADIFSMILSRLIAQ